MSTDKTKVYVAMTVFPAASKTTAKFSNAAYYVFHTSSRASLAGAATNLDITCGFDSTQKISCWVGDSTNFIYGDASATTGLANAAGSVKVFAGVRKDHFFFNLAGFNDTRAFVKANAAALTLNTTTAVGCPIMPTTALATAASYLSKTNNGAAAPVDFFLSLNTLAIVMEIDTAILNKGGSLLSVSAATHRKG